MDERTNGITNEGAKLRIWRRIAVKGVVFVIWAIGMLTLALHGDQERSQHTDFYMLFAVLVVWVVSTVRNARRLLRTHAQKDRR